jgi:hypothetical protein
MKKLIYLLVLAASTGQASFAQDKTPVSNADKTFEPPANSIRNRFVIDLKNGNKMQIELSEASGINYFRNIDSLLREFIHDMAPFKDSLSDELMVKKIDYKIDSSGRKEIRIQRFKPKGDSYVIERGELAALKLEQDTINIISFYKRHAGAANPHHIPMYDYRRVTFFINRVSDLPTFILAGLNDKIGDLTVHLGTWWTRDKTGEWHLDKDPSISASRPRGVVAAWQGDNLGPIIDVNMQNYKGFFTPSFSLGLVADFNNENNIFNGTAKYLVGISWDPYFVFQNVQGKLQTFRNDFIDLRFGFGSKEANRKPRNANLVFFSLGYLVKRSGDYFDKNTFRLGVGRISLFEDRIGIEPAMFFNNFFKGVSPSVRISF